MFDGYSCVLLLQRAAPAASSGWGLKASLASGSRFKSLLNTLVP
jgi:hypothetical protein